MKQWSRTEALYGKAVVEFFHKSSVLVAGLGGVGSYAAEALLRSGIGTIGVIDCDRYDMSNINRQLYATLSTIGERKTDCFFDRAKDINPQAEIIRYPLCLDEDNVSSLPLEDYDYVVDAIDDVRAKLMLIEQACLAGCKVVSAMGAGNKRHPEQLKVSTIYKTCVCPLAKIIRREAKKRQLPDFWVVYSEEDPVAPPKETFGGCVDAKKIAVGSAAFVPSAMGIMMASVVVNSIAEKVV